MAWKPLLAKLPAQKRAAYFGPVAAAVAFAMFFVVGLATNSFIVSLVAGPVLGVAVAFALYGLPEVRRADGKPWIEPKVRPWMSIPTALVATIVLYRVVGLVVTAIEQVPIEYAAHVTLAIAVAAGVTTGLVAFGPPPVTRAPGEVWRKIPHDRRPWLFFPLGVVLTVVAYYGFGVLLTVYGGNAFPQALVSLPVALLSGFGLAYAMVGVPKPKRAVEVELPPVPARARPVLFVATVVALGPVFTVALGPFASSLGLGGTIDLFLGMAGGYVLAVFSAALAWGLPHRWTRHGDWRPSLPPNVRFALFVPVAIVAGGVVLLSATAAGLGFGPSAAIAAGVALLAGLAASGALKLVRRAPNAVREMPEMVKPVVFFGVWFAAGGVVYLTSLALFFQHPEWAVGLGAAVGFVAALAAIEGPTLADARRRRREAREELREMRREREARLGTVAPPPASPSDASQPRRGIFSRKRE